MTEYMYSAWFRSEQFPTDDQDGEWVAMWIVIGDDPVSALAWGDWIARRHSTAVGEPFIRSYIESPADYMQCDGFDRMLRVAVGDNDATDPFR